MSALGVLVTALLVVAMVAWLQSEARSSLPVVSPSGDLELRHGRRYLGLSIGCALGGPALLLLVLWEAPPPTGFDWLPFVLMVLLLAFMGPWMLVDAVRSRVRVSGDGVAAASAFYANRFLRWSQIDRVGYNFFCSCFVLRASGVPPIRVSRYLLGIDGLLQHLRAKVSPDRYTAFARRMAAVKKDAA